MSWVLHAGAVQQDHDVVAARSVAREVARLLGFDGQDQTRIATAASELARNAIVHGGGGTLEFSVERQPSGPMLVLKVSDQGPGIADPEAVLKGGGTTGMGLVGARRLMDQFEIASAPRQGTTVVLRKALPSRATMPTEAAARSIAAKMHRADARDPYQEVRQQNAELMDSLAELRRQQEELNQLNTELQDTNRGVVALYAELDERAEQLRKASEVKSRFLSHMSHEFRTPVNSILALSKMLLDRLDGNLTPEQQKQVEFIREAGEALADLVNDLLDLGRIEAGKIALTPEAFSVEEMFGALRGLVRPLLVNDAVTLTFEASDVPEIFSDRSKVAQILRNFLSNALKFTPAGQIRVTARHHAGTDMVEFAVADTGIGIAPADQERIFEEFVQIDSPIQRRVRGTGLGLSVSRKLAEMMNGEVRVESAPEQGSTFTLTIPRRLGPLPQQNDDGGPGAVLVIDDEPAFRYLVRRSLSAKGRRILEAADGEDGFGQALSTDPDIIFLDISMPGMDGFEVLSRLKADERTCDIPVVILTSRNLNSRDRDALSPAAAVLTKDQISREVLVELAHQLGLRRNLHA